MFKYKNEIEQIQNQYLEILQGFNSPDNNEDFYLHAVSLIDKCSMFWASKRMEILELLCDLTRSEKCFLLSGAIYLGIEGNGHYEFGAIGDCNIINDPIIRMKSFFYNDHIVSNQLKEYFCEAIHDTIRVLSNYSDCFIVVSIDSLVEDDFEENQELGEKVYWDILSSALHFDICSVNMLKERFQNLQQLERALGDNAKRFIFNDSLDMDISLKNRIDLWFDDNKKMIGFQLKNDIDKFYLASMSQIQQALDIIFKCLRFSLYPFIRFEITMQYFLLIAQALSNDKLLQDQIEYACVCYLFTKYVIPDNIETIDFKEFFQKCKTTHLSEQFRETVFSGETSLLSVDINDAISAMSDIFRTVIQNS